MTTASGTNQTFSRFQNLTKRVYSNKVNDLVPEQGTACEDIPFSVGNKVGDDYAVPISLTREAGHTFNADGSAFALNRSIASDTQRATIRGNEIVTRTTMAYAVMTRAMTGTGSKEGDKKAFVNATKYQMQKLVKAAKFVREAGLFYGGGSATAIPTNANWGEALSVTDNTGTVDVVFTVASWATGLWVGSENMEFDAYTLAGTKKNASGTAAAGDNVYRVTTVTPSTRTVRFTSNSGNTSTLLATNVLVPAGAYQKEQLGLAGVVNTSGSVWGISNSSYYLWKPKTVAVGSAQLTFEAIQTGCAKAFEVGYEGEIIVYMNPYTWQDVADDEAALVNYAQKEGGTIKKGFRMITFQGQNGDITLKSHKLMKQGFAYGIPADTCYRIGSTDVTFDMPGHGQLMRELEDTAGIEIRCYQDQAVFCETPGAIIEWSGIVNTRNSAS